ncbi:MAG: bifunctional phosphopantothenoylcysteine decarboxylase/phosphopantothenate synthase, partial [Gammaproteobacteria bacterium]|nr:bifunctional phosphopantothenoylcysteine decarboxylase/phosphopantothenate synthase [Gammaproteobacteria bacterium]
DPVRFISNHSSGKMGFAIAAAAARRGAAVRLITGPVTLQTPPGVERVDVISAEEMWQAVVLDPGEIFIATAAVADYRLETIAPQKIKKGVSPEPLTLKLIPNRDIVAAVAAMQPRPYIVGFAAETEDLRQNARKKWSQKGLDMVAANQVGGEDGGFDRDHNRLWLYWGSGELQLPYTTKAALAEMVVEQLLDHYPNPRPQLKRGV